MRPTRLAVLFAFVLAACHEHARGPEDGGAPTAASTPAPIISAPAPSAPILPTQRPPDARAPSAPPLPEPGEPVRLDLDDAVIQDVLPMLEAVSGEPVIVDPEAEPLVRCKRVSLRTEHEVSPDAATQAILAALRGSGLAVIDTKKGIVLQKASGAAVPPCPAP